MGRYDNAFIAFQSKKKRYMILINVIFTLTLVISLLYQHYYSHRADFNSFYYPSQHFLHGENIYQTTTFVYLNYFVVIFPIFYLPYIVSISIWIVLHYVIANYIILKCDDVRDFWYMIGTSYSLLYDFISLNVELFLVLAIFLYDKYYEKKYSPLFLLLGLYKPTFAVPVSVLIFYRWQKEKKFPYHQIWIGSFVCGIIILSSLMSINQGLLDNIRSMRGIVPSFFIRPSHFYWFFYPLREYLRERKVNVTKTGQIAFGILFASIVFSVFLAFAFVEYF